MDPTSRIYTLIGAGICCAGAAALACSTADGAGDASQSLEDQAVALLDGLAGTPPSAGAAQQQPPTHQPQPQPPQPPTRPVRPGRR